MSRLRTPSLERRRIIQARGWANEAPAAAQSADRSNPTSQPGPPVAHANLLAIASTGRYAYLLQ
jgi:hypothetical protein